MYSDNKKIDFLSKFYCIVHKPLYYVLTVISIVPFVVLSTVVDFRLASTMFMISTVLYFISMLTLYKLSYKHKVKKEEINLQKVKLGRKLWFVISTLMLVFISIILASGISVILVLNGLS